MGVSKRFWKGDYAGTDICKHYTSYASKILTRIVLKWMENIIERHLGKTNLDFHKTGEIGKQFLHRELPWDIAFVNLIKHSTTLNSKKSLKLWRKSVGVRYKDMTEILNFTKSRQLRLKLELYKESQNTKRAQTGISRASMSSKQWLY